MITEDEFNYPQHVQDALDFVEQGTRDAERREADERRYRRMVRESRHERRDLAAQRKREAASEERFWAARRKQREAQQAKRRDQPAEPEGWVRP